jgi:hypothetical protein
VSIVAFTIGTSTLNIFGGTVGGSGVFGIDSGTINIYGGNSGSYNVSNNSQINFFGFGLTSTITSSNTSSTTYALNGTLADGTSLSGRSVTRDNTATLNLINAPEPGTLSLLALGGAGIIGRRLRRRK